MKKARSIEASQVALAMKVIALHGKKQKVCIYASKELATMQMPEEQEVSHENLFNWNKLKNDEPAPLDEEVVFNKSKLKDLEVEKDINKGTFIFSYVLRLKFG